MGEKSMWKRLIAEFIGTFMFVLVGAGAVAYFASTVNYTLMAALAFGLIMVVIGYLFGTFSGAHINPAVSLGVAIVGRMGWGEMILYWIAQLLGGLLAAFLVYWIFGTENYSGASIGSLTFTNAWKAVAVETIITTLIVFTFLVISKNWKMSLASGLVLGAVVTASFIFAGPLTGGSGNPARSFGPALVSGNLGTLWIYLLGPLLGAVIASILYSIMFYSSYSPIVIDECGNTLKNECCDNILEKKVQAVNNCGEKMFDENCCPIMYTKRKIDTSKGSYRIGVKRDKENIKYGYNKETGKLVANTLIGLSAEDLAKVGPCKTALFDLPVQQAIDKINADKQANMDQYEMICNAHQNSENGMHGHVDVEIIEATSIHMETLPEINTYTEVPESVIIEETTITSEPIVERRSRVRDSISSIEEMNTNGTNSISGNSMNGNSMVRAPRSSKLSELISNGMATKTPFQSPTSLSRAMSGSGIQM